MKFSFRFPEVQKQFKIGGNLVIQELQKYEEQEVELIQITIEKRKYCALREPDGQDIIIVKPTQKIPTGYKKIIKLRKKTTEITSTFLSQSDISFWLAHPLLEGNIEPEQIINSWKGEFNFKQEDLKNGTVGLRIPQLGAIHAALAHWSYSRDVATIVMPTGTGKTETMLSLLIIKSCPKLLVIVPTDPLREQVSEKFIKLGELKRIGAISANLKNPVVGIFENGFKDINTAKDFIRKSNVIIATANILHSSTPEILEEFHKASQYLFVDEAHHSEASSWFKIRDTFKDKLILQFTATPFRNDNKQVKGKIIYSYPLSKAQEEGYFKKIDFISVREYDPSKSDKVIAEAGVKKLREDRKKYKHILMARVESISRAKEVYTIYSKYEFKVEVIHTRIGHSERKRIKKAILNREVDIIVCVDMLGEGFDLPELKIGVFHDVRKSLPATLQIIGRFTRTKFDTELGNASIVVNVAGVKVSEELEDLYSLDPDWNAILPRLSEQQITAEIDYNEFIEGFKNLSKSNIPIQNLRPAMSTVIFKNHINTWNPRNFKEGLKASGTFDHILEDINSEKNVLVVVTGKRELVDWGNIQDFCNITWTLYIIHWNTRLNLLFIYSSDKGSVYHELAKSIVGDEAELIWGGNVFKCLSGINRLKLQNVGLSEQIGKFIRFIMRVGPDVETGLSLIEQRRAKKSVIFGSGFENGNEISIGCSYKGRIWSKRVSDINTLIKWFDSIGRKILDPAINADEVLKHTLKDISISKRPAIFPFYIDWNEEMYKNVETKFQFIDKDDNIFDFYNSEIALVNPSNEGDIRFAIISKDTVIGEFTLELYYHEPTENSQGYNDYAFRPIPSKPLQIGFGKKRINVEEFFYQFSPLIYFVDGSIMEGNIHTQLNQDVYDFDKNEIISWDWTGINLRNESQDVNPKIKDSIQFKVIEQLKISDYDIIYDDDYSGEIADVITIKRTADKIAVELYHLKYAHQGVVSGRIDNLYEVCGQAQKSEHWKHKDSKEFFDHLLRRETKTKNSQQCSRLEKGTVEELVLLQAMAKRKLPVEFIVFIVQPGLSKDKISKEQLTLLAVTENFLHEKSLIELKVIGS